VQEPAAAPDRTRPCELRWLSGGIAPLAWWLAATSRWRTTSPLRATSDQTCLLQSIRRQRKSDLGQIRFPPPSAKVQRFTSAFGGDRRRTPCLCYRESTGCARISRVAASVES